MSSGFPYWQFHCDRWLSGKISAFTLAEQGLFLHFCMMAWVGDGLFEINPALLQRKFNMPSTDVQQALQGLVDCEVVYREGEHYGIKFIDEQLEALHEKRGKLSKAGARSAEVRAAAREKKKEQKSKGKVTREEKNVEQVFNNCSTDVEPQTPSKNPPKQSYGEFGKVKLTDEEHAKLAERYGDKLETAIDFLDSYMESKGKRYASCYAVMKKGGWVWEKVGVGLEDTMPPGETVATIPTTEGPLDITTGKVAEWKANFPRCDVPATLVECAAVLKEKPLPKRDSLKYCAGQVVYWHNRGA